MYLNEFEIYLREETFLKEETIHAYLRIVKNFLSRSVNFNIDQFKNELRSYLLKSMDKGYSIATINAQLTALKKFSIFLLLHYPDEIQYNLSQFPRLRKEEKLPRTLLNDDVERIQFALRAIGSKDPTSEFVARLMFNHGLMPRDIKEMRIDNIDFQRGMIIYHRPQSNVPRMMVLIKGDFQAFIEYLNSDNYDINNRYMIQNSGEQISEYQIRKVTDDLSHRIQRKVTPNLLKNTFIRQCLENGMSEFYLQIYMGYKSIKTLARYQQINFSRLQNDFLPYINTIRNKIFSSEPKSKKARNDIIEIYKDVQRTVIREDEEGMVDL